MLKNQDFLIICDESVPSFISLLSHREWNTTIHKEPYFVDFFGPYIKLTLLSYYMIDIHICQKYLLTNITKRLVFDVKINVWCNPYGKSSYVALRKPYTRKFLGKRASGIFDDWSWSFSRASFFHFVRQFCNQVFTCISDRFRSDESSARLHSETYRHFANSFSIVCIWWTELK